MSVHEETAVTPHGSVNGDVEKKPDAVQNPLAGDAAPENRSSSYTILPWRIGLFLLTSTFLQNLAYAVVPYGNYGYDGAPAWTAQQNSSYISLVFHMAYLGPIFGLIVDLTRVFRERYRPVIIISLVVQAILLFLVTFMEKIRVDYQFGSTLVVMWLLEVVVMFMYIPMNGVVIWHGNSACESAYETSARIGGLMAQAMVWRTTGTFLYTLSYTFKPSVTKRTKALTGAILSLVLILQVIFLMKRSYFVDSREASLSQSTPVLFYKSLVNVSKRATSRDHRATATSFMFILCFSFIYTALPDILNNSYLFDGTFTHFLTVRQSQVRTVMGSLGTVIGAVVYALWMHWAYNMEKAGKESFFRVSPTIIVFAGCTALALGMFVQLIGSMAQTSTNADWWRAFLIMKSFLQGAFNRFSFMPSLSLAAMHAPRNYETAAFELWSVATQGGGYVSTPITTMMYNSLNIVDYKTYWRFDVLCCLVRYVCMIIAVTLPKYRDEEENDAQERISFEEDGSRGSAAADSA